MNHLSLFSGIGGIDLAAEWAGFRTIGFVERDQYCQRVLRKRWPNVPIWDDVCEVDAASVQDAMSGRQLDAQHEVVVGERQLGDVGARDSERDCGVTIISGGFPCQPHSVAGKRQASGDERDLWGECARIAGELRPRWCVWENVPGLLTSERGRFFGRVLRDMESLGYLVGWCTYGAVDVGAPHRRERVFIVCRLADADLAGSQGRDGDELSERTGEWVVGTGGAWRSGPSGECWISEPKVGRVATGVPRRVDRLRALGNAVVPQQIYPVFKAIAEYERDLETI